jgi:hypothetical protein
MKYLIVFILIVCLSNAVTAQPNNERLGIAVKFLPQHLLPHTYSMNVEYFPKNNPQRSFIVGFSLIPEKDRLVNDKIAISKLVEHGFGIDLQMRSYFQRLKSLQSGFYYSPIFRFEYFQSDYIVPHTIIIGVSLDSVGNNSTLRDLFFITNKQTIITNQIGLHLGFQYVFLKYLLIDIYVGAAYRHSFSLFRNGKDAGAYYPLYSPRWFEHSFDRAYSGIIPKLGFQIGFAF